MTRRVTVCLVVTCDTPGDELASPRIAEAIAEWAARPEVVSGLWTSGERVDSKRGAADVNIRATWTSARHEEML